MHTTKVSPSSKLVVAAAPDAEASYDHKLISRVLAVGDNVVGGLGEGSKREWLIETRAPDTSGGAAAAAAPASAAQTTRSVFGERIGSKSEWLKGEDVAALQEGPRDKEARGMVAAARVAAEAAAAAAARSRSASPSKMWQRGMSPGGDGRRVFDAKWAGEMGDARCERELAGKPVGKEAGEEEDSIQKWGEWMLGTLSHASPGMRYNGDSTRRQPRGAPRLPLRLFLRSLLRPSLAPPPLPLPPSSLSHTMPRAKSAGPWHPCSRGILVAAEASLLQPWHVMLHVGHPKPLPS